MRFLRYEIPFIRENFNVLYFGVVTNISLKQINFRRALLYTK
jgi:hypothetical protein